MREFAWPLLKKEKLETSTPIIDMAILRVQNTHTSLCPYLPLSSRNERVSFFEMIGRRDVIGGPFQIGDWRVL